MKSTSLFALGAALAASAPTLAQTTTPPQQAPAAAPAPAAAHSEAQLRGYARAWIELADIQQELQPQIQAATGEARTALERQASERMRVAVERNGLDPDTFNQISTAMRTNAALSQQINAFVQETAAARQQTAAQDQAGAQPQTATQEQASGE